MGKGLGRGPIVLLLNESQIERKFFWKNEELREVQIALDTYWQNEYQYHVQ